MTYDPIKAVHQIKLKHEAVVNAALIALHYYAWQGEPRLLAEAMKELETAITNLQYTQPPTVDAELTRIEGEKDGPVVQVRDRQSVNEAKRERLRKEIRESHRKFDEQFHDNSNCQATNCLVCEDEERTALER